MIKSSNSNLGTAVQNSAMLQSYLERKKKLLNNEIKSGEVGEKIVTAPKSKIDVSNIDLSNIKPNTLGTGDTLTPEETQRMLNDPRDFNIVKSGIKTTGKGVMVGVANVIESTNAIGTKILGKDANAINAKNLLREGDTGDKALDVFRGVTNFGWRSFPAYQFAHQMLGINQTSKESWERLEELYKDNQDNEQLKRVYNELKSGTYKGSADDLDRELSEIQTTIANEFRNKYTEDERIRLQEQLEENKTQYGEGIANKVLEGTSVVGQMVPTVLAGLINPTASVVTIGLNAGGGAYAQALSEGAQADEAYNYGVLSGVIEAIIEQFGGERINRALGLKTKSPTGGWINSIKNKYLRFAIGVGKDVLEEGTEEVVATILDPFLQRITYNENANYDNIWQEIGNAFVDSIIPTLLLGGFGTARRSLENITINSIEKINSSPNLTTQQKAIGKNQIEQINKETSKKITQIEKTMLDKEQIPQNNVQNISKIENTYQNQKAIEEDIKNNIDKTTLTAGKNSNTRQKRRQIVTEYLKNKYPNNEIEFAINYDTGDVRIGNIRNKQALEQYEKGTMEIRQKQAEEYNRKHPETTVEDELNLTYNELPDNKQTSDILEINDRIDELSQKLNQQGYDISIEHSKGSLDASYINVGTKQIRVANHYKSGVSGRGADIDINMSEYGSKNVLLKDIERQIKEIGSAEKTRHDVDIKNKKEYNERTVERKQDYKEGEIHASFTIQPNEVGQISSEVSQYRKNDKDGLHYIDLSKDGYFSYIYKKQGDSITPIVQLRGHEDVLNFVRRRIENGNYKEYGTARRWSSIIRNEYRNYNDNISNMQYSRQTNKNDVDNGKQDRQQPKDNRRRIDNGSQENSYNLKNSEQQSSNFMPENEERYDVELEQEELKDADMSSNILDGFYSQLENTIINKMPRQASSKDIMNLIQKNGVKQDEIAWTGIDDYLASKETVTKDEVLEYIRANQIEIEEVIKDDGQKARYEQREDEIRKEMDDLYYEAFKIMEKYNIHMRVGDPFDTIDEFLAEHGEDEIYNLVDLGNFASKSDGEYYLEGEDGESFKLDEMHREIDELYDMYNKRKDLEEELGEIPETAYGYADDFEDSTKFKRFTTKFSDMGENYREILFRLPNAKGAKPYYKREHWDDISNIFAHTRLQDYKDMEGNKVLFIEEIQSDMHQEGRTKGYINKEYSDNFTKIEKEHEKTSKELKELENAMRKAKEKYADEYIKELNEKKQKNRKAMHELADSTGVINAYEKLSEYGGKAFAPDNVVVQLGRDDTEFEYEKIQEFIKLYKANDKMFYEINKVQNAKYTNDLHLVQQVIDKLVTDAIFQQNIIKRQNLLEEIRRLDAELSDIRKKMGVVDPIFPFKKNWHEFVLRKIINEAVKQGYDKVAWTTGKQQNDRYNLAKYIDSIHYRKTGDKYSIETFGKNGEEHYWGSKNEQELEELLGKEITQKIISGEYNSPKLVGDETVSGVIKNADLEIGGEGMKGFYDKIIPEYLNKYLKKWDSKIEEVIISEGLEEHKQQGFSITPKMIEAVNTVGQPLYEKTTEGQKANINRVRNAVMDILGLEEIGNKKILDEMAIRVNFAINRNALDDKEIKRIVNDISKELVNITEPTVTEKRIKAILQGTKIYVPENVKKDIVEWNVFRKNLFGTLKLSNDEQNEPIDTFYQELNEMFGEVYFPSKISNEADQLKKIAQVGKSIRTKRISFEKYFKNEYGKEAWAEVLEDIENELKDIREELSYEINTKSDELKLTPELFTALGNVGIPIEMLEDDKNEWAKGIAKFFSDDYKYYEQNLKDIEKQNLETGTRTTNYILNKRRIDVLLGRVPRNEKYGGGVSPRDIRESIEKSINKKIGVKGFRAKAYGVYKPNVDAIRVKDISNIETELHELGHRIDYKVLKNIITNESSDFRKELNSLSQRAFLNTYDTPEMKRLTKQIAKTKDTIKNLEKYLDARNMSKRANPNSKARLNARERLEKAKIDLPELEAELEKAIVSDTNVDNMREGWAEATKRFVVDNENFIKEYPEVAKYILNEMENNKALNKQLTDLITLAEKYINSTPEEQISALISIGEDTDKQEKRKFFDQYMYNMHDDLWDIKKWQKNISKSKGNKYYETRAEDNIYTLMRLNKANEDVIINSLKYGIISDNGNRVTKGITDIIEKITPGEYQNLRNFMIARRTLDYFAKGLASGVQVADTIALINHYSKDAKLVQMANDLTEMQNKTLEYLGKDFMDKADMKELRKWNRLYIPMKRVFDGKVNSSTGGKQLSKLTKERTGSQRDIIDPLESIIQNTSMLISKKRQNDWMKKVADQIKESGYAEIAEEIDPPQALKAEVSLELFKNALEEQGVDTDEIDLEVVARIFNPKLNDEATMTIGFMDNGKLRALQFKDKNVYKVVSEGGGNVVSDVLALADKVTGLLRLGATQANLEFAIPNVISDTMGAWIYSESGFVPGVDSIKGVIDYMMANYDWANDMVKNTEYGKNNKYMYDLYMQSGATMSTRVASYRPEVQDYLKEIFGKNASKVYSENKKTAEKAVKDIWEAIKKAPHSVQDLLTAIPELSEQGTRFANFKKDYNYFKKKGYNHKNALIQSAINTRDITTDFNRMGNYFRVYNRLKAFSSARAQSIYRFAEGMAKQPKKLLPKIGAMVAISIAILKASIDADREEYEEIADQTKKDNFLITLPNGEFLKIKKPQGTVRSIINFFEMLYGVGAGSIPEEEYEQAWNNWVRDTVEENSGIELDLREGRDIFQITQGAFLPTVLEPIIENAQNVDFYYGNPIIPYGKENLRPSEQYDENTSQTAIIIGDVFNISPAKLENLITGWFAGVGQQALDISDKVLGELSKDIPEQPAKEKSEQFVLKRFFANPYRNSDSVSEVYDNMAKLEELKEYGEATESDIEKLDNLEKATKTMSDLNKKIKTTRNSLTLNAEEKKNKIKELQELRTDTARYYLGKELINTQNEEQIKLYEFYPPSESYNYQPNKLTKVTITLTEEEKKKYAEICKKEYEDAMAKIEKKASYKNASEEEKIKQRDSELTKARNIAKEEVLKEAYKRNKGAK